MSQLKYIYKEKNENRFDIYLTDEEEISEHIGTIYNHIHAKIICRLLNNKIKLMQKDFKE